MRRKTSLYFSLFYIFLSIGHELTAAHRASMKIPFPLEQPSLNGFSSAHDQSSGSQDQSFGYSQWAAQDQPSIYDVELDPITPVGSPYNADALLEDEESRQILKRSSNETTEVEKRWASAVILGITIGVTLAGLGFEAYLKVKKCCGLYPQICTYNNQINEMKNWMKPKFKELDFRTLMAKNILVDVTQINKKILEVWLDIKRIGNLKTRLLRELAPAIIKQFNIEWAKVEAGLRVFNDTYRKMTFVDYSNLFESIFDNYKSSLMGLSGLFGTLLSYAAIPAFKKYKQYSLNKNIDRLGTGQSYKQLVSARHTKAAKVLGVNRVGLNNHIRDTAQGQQNRKFKAGRYGKIVKGVNVAFSLVSIGAEAIMVYMKVKQCQKVRDAAKDTRDKMRRGKKDVVKVINNVTSYISLVDRKGFQYVVKQLTGENFLKELEVARKIAANAGTTGGSKHLKKAAVDIELFITDIKGADSAYTYTLCTKLADALAYVKFTYACMINKVQLVNYVEERCENGTNSLGVLFKQATKSFNTGNKVNDKTCKSDAGIPYFSLADMKATWKKTASKKSLNLDCLLNSKSTKNTVCRMYKKRGLTVDKIVAEYKKSYPINLSKAQVQAFLKNCPTFPLDPSEEKNVCLFRAPPHNWSDQKISSTFTYDLALVKKVKCNGNVPAG